MAHVGSNLPSDVVEDCDVGEDSVDGRVPMLGLHPMLSALSSKHPSSSASPSPLGNNPVTGSTMDDYHKQLDSITDSCESGVCMSFQSSIGSIDSFSRDIQKLSLDTEQSVIPPQTSLTVSDSHTGAHLASIDEGFHSGLLDDDLIEPFSQKDLLARQCTESSTCEEQTDSCKGTDAEIQQIFSQDEDGDTQLHIAIIQQMETLALHMIHLAPDHEYLNIQNNLRQSPLHLATITRQPNIIRRLVIRGAALDSRDRHGNTALHISSRDGDLACVKSLTWPLTPDEIPSASNVALCQQIPQDPEIKNYYGETCLHLAATAAAAASDAHVLVFLTSHRVGANVNAKDGRSGRTVLHHAVEAHRSDLVLFLVYQCHADVNALTFDGSTPLKLAMGRGYHEIARVLIDTGADTSVIEPDSDSSSDSEEELMDSSSFVYDDFLIGGQPISLA